MCIGKKTHVNNVTFITFICFNQQKQMRTTQECLSAKNAQIFIKCITSFNSSLQADYFQLFSP